MAGFPSMALIIVPVTSWQSGRTQAGSAAILAACRRDAGAPRASEQDMPEKIDTENGIPHLQSYSPSQMRIGSSR